MTTIEFVEGIVERFPSLGEVFAEHVSDNFGEVLPHLFFGDLTRYVVSAHLGVGSGEHPEDIVIEHHLTAMLKDLEVAYAGGDPEVQELIAVSFLENLPRPDEEGSGIRARLGPQLTAQLCVIG